jgi:excisionase family DNA binding protein
MSERDEPDDYLLPQEAARILGVSPKTVTRWAAAGWLDHIVTLGGHRRYSRQAVETLARHMRAGTAPRLTSPAPNGSSG